MIINKHLGVHPKHHSKNSKSPIRLSKQLSSKKLSFIEQKEYNIQKQKELDDRIDRVISETLDDETKAVLYRKDSIPVGNRLA